MMRKNLSLCFFLLLSIYFLAACSVTEEDGSKNDQDETANEEATDNQEQVDQPEEDGTNKEGSSETSEENNADSEWIGSKDESISDDGVTEEEAVALVRAKLDKTIKPETYVEVDNISDKGNYVVHVYDIVENEGVTRTTTIGWYNVNAKNGTIENLLE